MEEKKKSKGGLIILLLLLLIIIGVLIWWFLIRKPEEKDNKGTETNTQENKDNTDSKTKTEYDYRDGVLTQVKDKEGNPKQTDFVIDGIILIGNRHTYVDRDDTIETIAYFVKQGYKKEGLNSSYYLGEWIEMYIDTKYTGSESDVKILITPHQTIEEFQKLSLTQLEEITNEKGGCVIEYQTPEEDNYKYVGNGHIHQDYPEGKYDILFYYKQELVYFIELSLTKEE